MELVIAAMLAIGATCQSTKIVVTDSLGAPMVGAFVFVSSDPTFQRNVFLLGPTVADGSISTGCLSSLPRAYVKASMSRDVYDLESSPTQEFFKSDEGYPPENIGITLDLKSLTSLKECYEEQVVWVPKYVAGRLVYETKVVRKVVPCDQEQLRRYTRWAWDLNGCRKVHAGYVWMKPRLAESLTREACAKFKLCERCQPVEECECVRPVLQPTPAPTPY